MIATMREDTLLGSYQEREYSKGFQKMMNNVVAKIYRNKGSKQNVFKTLAPLSQQQPITRRESTRFSFIQELNRRKNSSPIAFYCSNFPKTNRYELGNEASKYSLPSFKLPGEYNKTPKKSTKKCFSLSSNSPEGVLYKKISDYNTCLITKTYKFQEKEKLAIYLDDEPRESQRTKSPFYSKIKRCENFKRNNRWIHSKGKFVRESQQIMQPKEDFKPWQTEHCEEFEY